MIFVQPVFSAPISIIQLVWVMLTVPVATPAMLSQESVKDQVRKLIDQQEFILLVELCSFLWVFYDISRRFWCPISNLYSDNQHMFIPSSRAHLFVMMTNRSLVLVVLHLNVRGDSSWLIYKPAQTYGEWDIDLVLLITRENDFSTSESHSD